MSEEILQNFEKGKSKNTRSIWHTFRKSIKMNGYNGKEMK